MKPGADGHISKVATTAERPGSSGWSQLEQSFFDTAPPDVAVIPPPAPTFDDLGPVLPERRKFRRPLKSRAWNPRARRVLTRLGAVLARVRPLLVRLQLVLARLRPALARVRPLLARVRPISARVLARVRPVSSRVRPALARARAQADAAARDGLRRLSAGARRAKETSKPALRAATSRFLDELPGERPNGRTILATLAVIVVLCGLSATVLGRVGRLASTTPPAPSAPIVGSTP